MKCTCAPVTILNTRVIGAQDFYRTERANTVSLCGHLVWGRLRRPLVEHPLLGAWSRRGGGGVEQGGDACVALWWNRVQDTTLTILPFSCYYSNHYSGY